MVYPFCEYLLTFHLCCLQALQKFWKDHQEESKIPTDAFKCIELVLNKDNNLCTQNRLQGENEVRLLTEICNRMRSDC